MADERRVRAKVMQASFGVPWLIYEDVPLEWFDYPDTLQKMADAETEAFTHYRHRKAAIETLKP